MENQGAKTTLRCRTGLSTAEPTGRATMLAVLFRKGKTLGAWFLRKSQTGEVAVEYQNSAGDTWNCGTNPHGTPIELILDWVIQNAEAGDAILFKQGALWMQK